MMVVGLLGGCSASPEEKSAKAYFSAAKSGHDEFYRDRLQKPTHVKVGVGDLIPPMVAKHGAWFIYEFADVKCYVSELELKPQIGPLLRTPDDLQSDEQFVIDISVLLDSSDTSLPYEYWNGLLSSEQCKKDSSVAELFQWEDTNHGVYQRTPRRTWNARKNLILSVKIGSVKHSLRPEEFVILTPVLYWYP